MIASHYRRSFRFMSTLALDQRQVLARPQRIQALPKRTATFKHEHCAALGIQFYGASSASEVVPVSPDSDVGLLLRPWLLPHLSAAAALSDAELAARADEPTALDFLSLLADAARNHTLETATHVLAHALLRAAGFQTHLSAVRSGPHIDVTLGLKEDQLRLSSVPDHTVAARLKRTLLVTSEAKGPGARHKALALPQLAGAAVCAAVQDYADFGQLVPSYRVFGLRFYGARMLAARFDFPAAYLGGLIDSRQLVQTVAVPLWGGPPMQATAGSGSSERWGLDLVDAEQRRQAFQLLTAMAREVDATAAVVTAMAMAAGQMLVPAKFRT